MESENAKKSRGDSFKQLHFFQIEMVVPLCSTVIATWWEKFHRNGALEYEVENTSSCYVRPCGGPCTLPQERRVELCLIKGP